MLEKIKNWFKGDRKMTIKKFKGFYTPEEHQIMLQDYQNKIEACEVKKNALLMEKAAFEAFYAKQKELQQENTEGEIND